MNVYFFECRGLTGTSRMKLTFAVEAYSRNEAVDKLHSVTQEHGVPVMVLRHIDIDWESCQGVALICS